MPDVLQPQNRCQGLGCVKLKFPQRHFGSKFGFFAFVSIFGRKDESFSFLGCGIMAEAAVGLFKMV